MSIIVSALVATLVTLVTATVTGHIGNPRQAKDKEPR